MMSSVDLSPVYLSIKVAGLATLVTAIVGMLTAYVLVRKDFFGKSLLESFVTLPLVLPPTVLGYYLLVLIGRRSFVGQFLKNTFDINLIFTWQAAVIAASIASFPLFVRSAQASIESIDTNLLKVARTLGKSEWQIFWRVSVPLAWRGILSGSVLAFSRALGDFGATLMVAGSIPGKTQTVPLAIFDAVSIGNKEVALFLVSLITIVAILVLLVVTRLTKSRLTGF